jgi:hypothetical protein
MLFERKKKHCQKKIQLNQKYLTLIFLLELDPNLSIKPRIR